jgi:hypothetical protein
LVQSCSTLPQRTLCRGSRQTILGHSHNRQSSSVRQAEWACKCTYDLCIHLPYTYYRHKAPRLQYHSILLCMCLRCNTMRHSSWPAARRVRGQKGFAISPARLATTTAPSSSQAEERVYVPRPQKYYTQVSRNNHISSKFWFNRIRHAVQRPQESSMSTGPKS